MSDGQVEAQRRTLSSARVACLWLTAALLAVGVPLVLARLGISREPGEWHWDDWVAQLTQIASSVTFFGIAWFLGRRSNARGEAVANAELITSMGALATSSARSFAGQDAQALRIAADARAALQHYPQADYAEQRKLTERVTDAYSDLIFGTFSRAAGLPRSVWNGLRDGADDVVADAEELARTASPRKARQKQELLDMADHIRFALRIGEQLRSWGEDREEELTRGRPWTLEVWRPRESDPPPSGHAASTHAQQERERVDRLALLYRRELTVVRDWDLLRRRAGSIHCAVALHVIPDSDDWLAPWYVTREAGRLVPVNVKGEPLGEEAARFDRLEDVGEADTHPRPLRHANLPPGMREAAIREHTRVLDQGNSITICVLTYDLVCRGGVDRRRIVLDGNHRLAAARRIAAAGRPQIQVLEFLVHENERVDDPTSVDEQFPGWSWKGFTPDVENVRGAWARRAEP